MVGKHVYVPIYVYLIQFTKIQVKKKKKNAVATNFLKTFYFRSVYSTCQAYTIPSKHSVFVHSVVLGQ